MLKDFSCNNCGGNDFSSLSNGFLRCNYCNSTFTIDSPITKTYENKKLTGDLQKGLTYIVHSKLIISGDLNKIRISTDLSIAPNALHVNKLKIAGDLNECTVILLEGATYEITGDLNKLF